LRLERLEERRLLSGADTIASAIGLSFANTSTLYQTAHVTEYLANGDDVCLNRIGLNAGDIVTASVNTAPYGGGLDSYLRIFQDMGVQGMGGSSVRQIASNDNFQGKDAGLTFQAPATGSYYVGISSFDNTAYNPLLADSGSGSSHGLFDLNLAKTTAAAPPGLVGASFKLSEAAAVWGDTVTASYIIQNRGELAAAPTTASLLVSASNLFNDSIPALQSAPIPALAGGDAYSGSFTVQLGGPDTPLAPFVNPQEIFLGLQIGSAQPSSPEQGNDWSSLQILTSQTAEASGTNNSLATAQPIVLGSRTNELALAPGGEAFFQIALTQSGNLTSELAPASGACSLALYDANGIPIVQSDGQSPANSAPSLTQGLTGSPDNGGTIYYLKVANLGETAGTYVLNTLFAPSASTLQTVPVGAGDQSMVSGDFNGDGNLDLVTGNFNYPDQMGTAWNATVLLGNGDGTFQYAGNVPLGIPPAAMAVGSFTGDGRLDIVVSYPEPDGTRILLGNGDGTFQSPQTIAGIGGSSLAVGDFTDDGKLDLAVGNLHSDTVTILLGNGCGKFQTGQTISVPGGPAALAVGDFNEDGLPDLAVADEYSNQVTVLMNQGNGLFQNAGSYPVGTEPDALVAADFNGDGSLDLAVLNRGSDNVTVLLGDGHGSFQLAGAYPAGNDPRSLVTGDFNGDGHVDLAAANYFSNNVTVHFGRGDGTFTSAGSVAVGPNPLALVAGDFNGDGRVDLATASYGADAVTVLLGDGAGTFPQTASSNTTGQKPDAMVTGDFTDDGRLDLAVANRFSNDVTILLGQGDGTFQDAGTFAAGAAPVALVAGDFNGDGRLDLAVADYGYSYGPEQGPAGITLLLGNGDGTFQEAGFINVGGRPSAVVAGDFNEDGSLDLAVAIKVNTNATPGNSVVLLEGDGHGDFVDAGSFATGSQPDALVEGDFTGDGHLDLAAADYGSGDVTVLLGNGQGSFAEGGTYYLGASPTALVAGDFDGDNHTDLAVAYPGSVTVLLNDGSGTFAKGASYNLGTYITSLVAGDFTGDGHMDLAAANPFYSSTYYTANTVTLLLGNGDGTFSPTAPIPVGSQPIALVAGDFNGDGRLDLATANYGSADVTVLLGTGTGSFLSPVLAPSAVQSTPLIADFTGSPVNDAVVLTQTGQILYRQGLTNPPGAFAPPMVLNPDPALAARALAVVSNTRGVPFLAALDANTFAVSGDPTADRVPQVTLYLPHANGSFTILANLDLPAGFLPANIASADLTGNGLGDLVISAAASDQIFVCLQTAPGVFGPATPYSVGVNPSAIALADLNGDGLCDIVVTDRFSGQVSVLLNQGNGVFSPEGRYRAGTGLYDLAPVNGTNAVQSLEGTNSVVAGSFGGGPGTDLVVSNGDSGSIVLLSGDGHGGFLNPQLAQTFFTGDTPTAVVAGYFITGDNQLDLAVLSADSDTVTIYRNNGSGGFVPYFTIGAGNQPTGLAVADVSRPGGGGPDGIPDLLIGNAYGDLLILAGNGDGTFTQYRRVDQEVSLAVAASGGTDQPIFYFSDQENDQLAYVPASARAAKVGGPTVYQNRSAGIQAPGPEAVVTVGGISYLMVANSGANEVLIYTLDPDGQPDPLSKQTYFTGTDPVSLTITTPANNLNHGTIPDLVVANEGSNDVSVFLGQMTGNTWTLSYRPRQSSGGLGPTDVAIADVPGADGSGLPDLLVSNGQSNNVSILVNRGNGFFINQSTATAPPLLTGNDPQQVFVGHFTGGGGLDLVTVNAGSNDVTLIANFLTNPVTSTIGSGGTFPVAAIEADVTGNGISDLLVANAGTGFLELLLGSPGGFEAEPIPLPLPGAHLSDLALVTAGNELEVYGTLAGRETALLLATFGPPVPLSNFFPPAPGFPSGLEILTQGGAVNTLEINPPSIPLALVAETLLAGGVIEQVSGTGFIANIGYTTPVSPFSGTGESESTDLDPPAAALRPPGPWGKDAGILLQNLPDPENKPSGQNGPDAKEPNEELESEGANTSSGGPAAAVGKEAQTAETLAVDLFWEALGEGLGMTGDPEALMHSRKQRTPEGIPEPGPLPGESARPPSMSMALPQAEFGRPCSPVPGQEQAEIVRVLIDPQLQQPPSEHGNSSAAPFSSEGSLNEDCSAELWWLDALVTAAAFTGFWEGCYAQSRSATGWKPLGYRADNSS